MRYNRKIEKLANNSRDRRKINNLIADLRGMPTDRSWARLKETHDLDSLLDSAIKRFKIGSDNAQSVIMENWKTIIGANFAHRACPITITSSNTLVIQVSNPTLRNELGFQVMTILKRLRAIPGCEHIKSITFRGQ